MDADELRNLADALEPMAPAPRFSGIDAPAACAYLRACADALDAGPVAVVHRNQAGQISMQRADGSPFDMSKYVGASLYPLAMPAVPDDALRAENERLIEAIKSLAMPAQAQPLRLPEPMTDEEICHVATCAGTFKFARCIEAETLRRVKEVNDDR